jgi:hypothetical protein
MVSTANTAATETMWGLGLKQLVDLPPQNIYNFGVIQYAGAPL